TTGFATGVGAAQEPSAGLIRGASAFWLSSDEAARARAASDLLDSGASFEALYDALRAAPEFTADAPTGRLDRSRRGADGRTYGYTALVPDVYDPKRAYPVLFYLHGGVNRPAWSRPGEWWGDYDRIADPDRIVVVPAGWSEATWWQDAQIDNLSAILAELSSTYNVDANRVHLLGISDGGTGAYYVAFRAASPWASFLPFIGHPAVLSSPRLDVDGQMYVSNLRNRPLMIVNGGRDRLYPTRSIDPFVGLFRTHGVELVYRPQPEAGHDMTWLPDEAARIDSFLVATPRDPLPDALEWETEDTSRGRFAWVVIDELGAVRGETDLPDRNTIEDPSRPRGSLLAFPHRRPSGRVVVRREGNEVDIRTEGVRRLRLLLSPEEFDLTRSVRVVVNGVASFEGPVEPSTETLLAWAGRDRDRQALFAAELSMDLARQELRE
ncbi:MAG: hypothetical protein MJB57_08740, partial [Gemmatimonadetes bacterium]|nr:hypothetical protein [Gemmatimonadota bacterium]